MKLFMKKNITLIIINILLLSVAFQVTNEDALVTRKDLEIGKTYINKNNSNKKIVLYRDYSAEIINCLSEKCDSKFGTFIVDNNHLELDIENNVYIYTIKSNNRFVSSNDIYITE